MFFAFWNIILAWLGKYFLDKIIEAIKEHLELKAHEKKLRKQIKEKIKEIKSEKDPKIRAQRMSDFLNS